MKQRAGCTRIVGLSWVSPVRGDLPQRIRRFPGIAIERKQNITPEALLATPLKDQNALRLYTIVAANFALFFATQRAAALFAGDWSGALAHWQSIAPAAFGLVLVGVVNAQASSDAKAQLVYMRRRNPLPGSEAFTRWGPRDVRVDMAALEAAYGPLPTAPAEQNRLWYRLLKTFESDGGVTNAHKESLFTRDYTFLAALMIIVLGAAAIATFTGVTKTLLYIAVLIGQFVLAGRAARHHGRRLVCTVLAVAGAKANGQKQAVTA